MSNIPKGFDVCAWEEADHVLTSEGWYSIKLHEHHGSIDSFTIYFEPGESEIGTFQAEDCLGMTPLKMNAEFEGGEEKPTEPYERKVDFGYIRDRTAADVRKVATLLCEIAAEIQKGDMAAFDTLVNERFELWWQMLLLRNSYLMERKGKTVTIDPQATEEEDEASEV